ncbi:DUF1684 domain-containing protein [Stenotrophomonas sp. YIM B06876]|uniref:DUF1684 domain-containing protein n=1 Tax=Stenotrophomonas sp. YIM B06876 TaxID=3060211 RepID=UPI00273846F6|nr:DUF1684 domain-containing protein [Stenotrophomonas sp. YIM B06876]
MGLRRWIIGIAVLLVIGCDGRRSGASDDSNAAPSPQVYAREIEQWRMQRLARLRAADGWLSYTGSGRLKPGRYRVGSGSGNQLVLPGGPARLGELVLDPDGRARFTAVAGSGATFEGRPLAQVELQPAIAGGAQASSIMLGAAEFYLVRTGAVTGWRYRDPGSIRRRTFSGIEHFPVQPHWRVVAQWHAFPTPRELMLLTSIGTPQAVTSPGEAVFEMEGRTHRLLPLQLERAQGGPQLFFLFSDRTSGKETYGGARYLFAEMARDGRVVLDFNRAENPPCALTPHVVCPIAPPANRLDLAVTAGEKRYLAGK